jgi:hypothetical protein
MDVRLVLKAPALWRIPILCCALPSGTEWYSWLLVLVGVWTCTSPLLSLDTPLLTLLSPTDADPTVLVRCSYEFEFELTRELRDAPLCSCQLSAAASQQQQPWQQQPLSGVFRQSTAPLLFFSLSGLPLESLLFLSSFGSLAGVWCLGCGLLSTGHKRLRLIACSSPSPPT